MNWLYAAIRGSTCSFVKEKQEMESQTKFTNNEIANHFKKAKASIFQAP